MRRVTKEEFDAFIATYPRHLVRDVTGICEPPLMTFNDFTIAPKWPESVVAKVILCEDSYPAEDGSKIPNEYLIPD